MRKSATGLSGNYRSKAHMLHSRLREKVVRVGIEIVRSIFKIIKHLGNTTSIYQAEIHTIKGLDERIG